MRWNKNAVLRASPVAALNRRPTSSISNIIIKNVLLTIALLQRLYKDTWLSWSSQRVTAVDELIWADWTRTDNLIKVYCRLNK